MRLLHTSDWHLGRSLLGEPLADAQAQALRHIVDAVDEHDVDAVLVAGDVYDRGLPPVEAVRLLGDTLAALADRVPTIVISGNHDSADRLGFGAQLFRPGMHVRTSVPDVGHPVELADAHGPVLVYALPFLDPDVARVALADDPDQPLARRHDAVVNAAMDRVRADLARRRSADAGARCVVMAHAFVVGATRPSSPDAWPVRSESERDLRVGGTEAVAAEVFTGADYVALGHLHGAQQLRPVGSTTLRYAGSPLRYSFSEANQQKSVTLVDLDAGGVAEVTLLPVPQPRGMTVLQGELADLLQPDRHGDVLDHWVQVSVTDAARPADMVSRVRERFPHALVVRHLPGAEPLLSPGHLRDAASRDPLTVVESFVRYVTGGDATAEELRAFEDAYAAVSAAERSA